MSRPVIPNASTCDIWDKQTVVQTDLKQIIVSTKTIKAFIVLFNVQVTSFSKQL